MYPSFVAGMGGAAVSRSPLRQTPRRPDYKKHSLTAKRTVRRPQFPGRPLAVGLKRLNVKSASDSHGGAKDGQRLKYALHCDGPLNGSLEVVRPTDTIS